ncbi:DUF3810 domain-containing protein [Anaerotruncus colihominis]|uniref:DUF3810 domain-containing protein n=1 Tax=Anaerotruncus colihominis TaxID=169435 RepID=UPI003511DB0A
MRAAVKPRLGLWVRCWWTLFLLPAGLLLIWLAHRFPVVTEQVYSRTIYPLLAASVGALTSLFPFSLFEIGLLLLLAAAALLLLYGMVWLLLALLRRPAPIRVAWKRLFALLPKAICVIFFIFVTTCGLNYHRLEFAQTSGLQIRDSSAQELAALCLELSARASELRLEVGEDASGVMRLESDFFDTAHKARDTFGSLSQEYAVFPNYAIAPKPVLNSRFMSRMQLTGQFTLFTFEANINKDAPDYSIPATMCHELAHTRGFMREDEANFIGYLACINSDSAEFQYSGVMLALVHASNRLYETDRMLYQDVASTFSDGVRRDFADNNAYWAQFEGPVAEVSDAVNNAYLVMNHQSDGVKSYGRMVDLLLADYRSRHNLI